MTELPPEIVHRILEYLPAHLAVFTREVYDMPNLRGPRLVLGLRKDGRSVESIVLRPVHPMRWTSFGCYSTPPRTRVVQFETLRAEFSIDYTLDSLNTWVFDQVGEEGDQRRVARFMLPSDPRAFNHMCPLYLKKRYGNGIYSR